MAGCERGCNNGRVFLEATKQFVPCVCRKDTLDVMQEESSSGRTFNDTLKIPVAYRSLGVIGRDILKIDGIGRFTSASVDALGSYFEKLNSDVYNGGVTGMSVYLHTTNLVDVCQYVYGVQKLALEKGLTVTPYISLNTLNGVQRVGDFSLTQLRDVEDRKGNLKGVLPELLTAVEGYRLISETDLTYYDYCTASLCILDATANTSERGWAALADILRERAKRGLSTIVTGYWVSTSPQAGKGLKYLIGSENTSRLDLLHVIELKSGRNETTPTGTQKIMSSAQTTKSDIAGGVSFNDLIS